MKITEIKPPRTFMADRTGNISIRHCANVELGENEQVTFLTSTGTEYDVVRKSWGYYATPSLNGRLCDFGLKAVIVRNKDRKVYLLLVEKGHEDVFQIYLDREELAVLFWLDSDEAVQYLSDLFQKERESACTMAVERIII